MAKLLPRNRPVPMAPPMAIMPIWPEVRRRLSPCSRAAICSKPGVSGMGVSSIVLLCMGAPRRRSGHGGAARILRLLPRPAIEHVLQDLDRVPDVGIAQVQRRESEAQYFGLAVVADDAARDQRLHDRIALRMADADVAAAQRVLARRHQRQRMAGAALFDQADEQVAQGE